MLRWGLLLGAAMAALLAGFTVVPAVLMATAVWFQRRYALDRPAGP
ncbi:hypothetical protein ACQEUU_29965 [Nonomuraea sp. CA-218870]